MSAGGGEGKERNERRTRVEARAEPVRGVVCELDRLLLRAELGDGEHRTEDLVADLAGAAASGAARSAFA